MEPFTRLAFFTIARDAIIATMAAIILVVAYRFDPPLAIVIAASVAMFYMAVMLVRAMVLTEERVEATEPWLVMQPQQRPSDARSRAVATERLETLLLRAAKTASGIAAALFALGLIASWF
jgi:hypothetical protein